MTGTDGRSPVRHRNSKPETRAREESLSMEAGRHNAALPPALKDTPGLKPRLTVKDLDEAAKETPSYRAPVR
jgi:hypothetical protein